VRIDADRTDRTPRALDDVLTWESTLSGERAALRRRVAGRTSRATGLPVGSSLGDLGRDPFGRVVQIVIRCADPASDRGPCDFWAYDVRGDRLRRLRAPTAPPGCFTRDLALWERRVASLYVCEDGRAAAMLRDRGRTRRLLTVGRYNGAFMAFGLDVSASSATVAEADADSNGTRVFHSWLFRDACTRQTIAEADEGVGDRIETAQLDGDRLWWVRKHQTFGATLRLDAALMSRRLGPGCAMTAPATRLRIPWVARGDRILDTEAAVSAGRSYITWGERGLWTRPVPGA
jgi:hypothetical protein